MRAKNAGGFSLLEMTIAIVIFSLLVGAVLKIATETMAYASYADATFQVQHESQLAFNRSAAILRKCGWNSDGVINYPEINAAKDELSFRMLTDLDGNGLPFDAVSGDLEWSDLVLTVRRNVADRTLYVYDGDTPVWTLGRKIDSVQFESFVEDAALNLRQIRMTITTSSTAGDGTVISYSSTGNIFMRN